MATPFEACIADMLTQAGRGKRRQKDINDYYNYRRNDYLTRGVDPHDASLRAMNDTFLEADYQAREKTKGVLKDLQVLADSEDRIRLAYTAKVRNIFTGKKYGIGYRIARAAMSYIDGHPVYGQLNLVHTYRAYRDQYWAVMNDVMDNFRKGAFGRQVGEAHLHNVVRELMGQTTGDLAAKEIAQAYIKTQDVMLNTFNAAGGSLRKLHNYYLPQKMNAAKLAGKEDDFVKDHMTMLDWNSMRHPDGTAIVEADKIPLLKSVWRTLQSGGKTKIDPKAFRGRGASIGNMLDAHRFLIYKDADSWLKMHETYGDGNVFDVIAAHIDHMAHKTALVRLMGRNPETWRANMKALAEREAGRAAASATRAIDRKAAAEVDALLAKGKRFDIMFEDAARKDYMDPHNPWASGIVGTAQLLTSAQLGSVVLSALQGDMLTSLAVKFINHMPLRMGIDTFVKAAALPGGYGSFEKRLARHGFIFDEAASSMYMTQRFTGLSTYGPAITRRIGDTVMRLSGINRITNAQRGTQILEHMGMLDDFRDIEFNDLPNKLVMERYGITKRDWDVVRKLPPHIKGNNAHFLRPLDILDSNLIDKDQLYLKFYNMISTEAYYMVPSATIEAKAILSGGLKPDTLAGAALHSLGMYKNFPVTFMQTFGRLAMTEDAFGRRLGFVAGLGIATVAAGALSIQMRQLVTGKTPRPMDNSGFWISALMAGGGLGMWGDFLFSGLSDKGRNIPETLGGPLLGFAEDTGNLFNGEFAWAASSEHKPWESKFGARLAEYFRRNTPGTSLWWARLALEREVWDRLQKWMDPRANQKFRAKRRRQQREFGNDYWTPPGESFLE